MAENICGGVKTSESEFQIVPATSTHGPAQLTAACGPNAASAAARWADQSATAPDTVAMYRAMRGLNLGGSDGLSDLDELTTTLRHMGYAVTRPNAGESALAFMQRMAGRQAVVWETSNGQALRDYLTGMGEDASNLQRHILCSWGTDDGKAPSSVPQAAGKTLPAGFWCSDGDSDTQNTKDGARYHWGLNQRLVYYPLSVVQAAQPIAALSVAPRVAIPGGTGMATAGVPAGWTDDGKTLIAPDGVPVVQGFRDYVLSHGWVANNTPLGPERVITSGSIEWGNAKVGPGSRQDFRFCSLGWTQAWKVYVIAVGQDISALATQVSAAQAQIAALQKQLLAAQQTPPPPPAADPVAQAALAALHSLKSALGEL